MDTARKLPLEIASKNGVSPIALRACKSALAPMSSRIIASKQCVTGPSWQVTWRGVEQSPDKNCMKLSEVTHTTFGESTEIASIKGKSGRNVIQATAQYKLMNFRMRN